MINAYWGQWYCSLLGSPLNQVLCVHFTEIAWTFCLSSTPCVGTVSSFLSITPTLYLWSETKTKRATHISVAGAVYYLDCLSVWWDDAEGGRGRLGAGTGCCHGDDRWWRCSGYCLTGVCLSVSWAPSVHVPDYTQNQYQEICGDKNKKRTCINMCNFLWFMCKCFQLRCFHSRQKNPLTDRCWCRKIIFYVKIFPQFSGFFLLKGTVSFPLLQSACFDRLLVFFVFIYCFLFCFKYCCVFSL